MLIRQITPILALLSLAGATTRPVETSSRADRILKALRDTTVRQVFVAAHRGDWRFFPENSIAGIERAITLGCDIIETDLRRTKDGHFVILHDKTLDRTTTGKGAVADFTLAELSGLRLKDALGRATEHPLPTLEQVLELCRGRALVYLDKTEDVIPEVQEVLERTGNTRHSFFYGRRTATELRRDLGPLASRINYIPKITQANSDALGYATSLNALNKPAAFILEFDRDDAPTIGMIPSLQSLPTRVWVSPIDPALSGTRTDDLAITRPDESWGWLLERGVSIFCTDRPAELLNYLRIKGLHD